jgi:hypothetical protein
LKANGSDRCFFERSKGDITEIPGKPDFPSIRDKLCVFNLWRRLPLGQTRVGRLFLGRSNEEDIFHIDLSLLYLGGFLSYGGLFGWLNREGS